ncbi:hypothetical protein EIP91_008098 [Steccherinum ochraceum]|uniref:Zinc-ribbon 15 domain-containing protein n=1 Tax=Steccherinum ochraceum TaxID=92696 RepID=A0A4R0R5P6_9APHY|nr:hypothetical protein EIP91_008098 [Steccherinum ochraceum]
MDFFICLPIFFGCTDKIRPDGDPTPRVCPRCHNASVISAKSRMWFELCFLPVIPMSSKRIWVCSICQWAVPIQPGGWEPTAPQYGQGYPQQGQWQGQWQQGLPSGYQSPPASGYIGPPPNAYSPTGQQAPPKH